jgi:nucleoside-diphosphate-sugar epimerase
MAHQMGRAGKGRRDEFWRTNVESTALIARLCAQAGIARLVFMSSIAARSSAEGGPQNDYGRSKREAESGLQRELATAVTDWCVMRPPLVYGPGNPGNMGRLLKLVDSGIPLPFASIRNTRSFMFIGNLVDAIITVLRHPGRIRDVFELGDGTELSTPALITALAKRIGRSPRLFPIPVPMLRYVARVADLFGAATGLSVPFDSYSMDRLTESLVVDWSHFRANFSWAPPVNPTDALGLVTPM